MLRRIDRSVPPRPLQCCYWWRTCCSRTINVLPRRLLARSTAVARSNMRYWRPCFRVARMRNCSRAWHFSMAMQAPWEARSPRLAQRQRERMKMSWDGNTLNCSSVLGGVASVLIALFDRRALRTPPRETTSNASALWYRKPSQRRAGRSCRDHVRNHGRSHSWHFSTPAGTDREFFELHLAGWIGRFFADVERTKPQSFYGCVGSLGRLFVDVEREAFAVRPERVDGSEFAASDEGSSTRTRRESSGS